MFQAKRLYAFLALSFTLIIKTGHTDPTPFEEYLSQDPHSNGALHAYRYGVQQYEVAEDNPTRDMAALNLFAGVINYYIQSNKRLNAAQAIAANKAMVPIPANVVGTGSESEQRARIEAYILTERARSKAECLTFQNGMKLAREEAKLWFARRVRAPEDESDGVFREAFNLWMKVSFAETCKDAFHRFYVREGKDSGVPLDDYRLDLMRFLREGPGSNIAKPLKLGLLVKDADNKLSYKTFLQLIHDLRAALAIHWYKPEGSDVTYISESYYPQLLEEGRKVEADRELWRKCVQRGMDFRRCQRGVEVVYFKGSQAEEKVSLENITQRMRTHFALHVTGGESSELPADHEGNFISFHELQRVLAELKLQLLETQFQKEETEKLLRPDLTPEHFQRVQSALVTLQGAITKVQGQVDEQQLRLQEFWFKTSPLDLHEPVTRAEAKTKRQHQLVELIDGCIAEEKAKYLETPDSNEDQFNEEVKDPSVVAGFLMKLLISVKSSQMLVDKLGAEEFLLEAISMLWHERKAAPTFTVGPEDLEYVMCLWNPSGAGASAGVPAELGKEKRERSWENIALCREWVQARSSGQCATAMILWDRLWTEKGPWTRFKELITKTPPESREAILPHLERLWVEHATPDVDTSTTLARVIELGNLCPALVAKAQAAQQARRDFMAEDQINPSKVIAAIQDAQHFTNEIVAVQEQISLYWDWARPLPVAIAAAAKPKIDRSQEGWEVALWDGTVQSILQWYDTLLPICETPIQVAVMLNYQGQANEENEFAQLLRANVTDIFGHWRLRPAEANVAEVDDPVHIHRLTWHSWWKLKQFIRGVMTCHGNGLPITLKGDVDSPLAGVLTTTRRVWAAPLPVPQKETAE